MLVGSGVLNVSTTRSSPVYTQDSFDCISRWVKPSTVLDVNKTFKHSHTWRSREVKENFQQSVERRNLQLRDFIFRCIRERARWSGVRSHMAISLIKRYSHEFLRFCHAKTSFKCMHVDVNKIFISFKCRIRVRRGKYSRNDDELGHDTRSHERKANEAVENK